MKCSWMNFCGAVSAKRSLRILREIIQFLNKIHAKLRREVRRRKQSISRAMGSKVLFCWE
jgi:hypothetical protein